MALQSDCAWLERKTPATDNNKPYNTLQSQS